MSKWKVFNKEGKYIKTISENNTQKLEEKLRKEGLYAHRTESFKNRPDQWNKLPFADKLKSLGWEFRNGLLINTEW